MQNPDAPASSAGIDGIIALLRNAPAPVPPPVSTATLASTGAGAPRASSSAAAAATAWLSKSADWQSPPDPFLPAGTAVAQSAPGDVSAASWNVIHSIFSPEPPAALASASASTPVLTSASIPTAAITPAPPAVVLSSDSKTPSTSTPTPATPIKPAKPGIEVIKGCMFSGKSSELMRRVRQHQVAKRSCLVVKHTADTTRYSKDCVASHNQVMMQATVVVSKLADIRPELLEKHQVLAIDEGQFYPDLFDFCIAQATRHGKLVIVAGLDLTANDEPFGEVLKLASFGKATQLRAICQVCSGKASLTRYVGAGRMAADSILPGGAERYEAVCLVCKRSQS